MNQHWVTFYFLFLILWLILTSLCLLLSSHRGLADLFLHKLVFLPSRGLLPLSSSQKISLRHRGITHDNLRTVTVWWFTEDVWCASSLIQTQLGCSTQARKRVASHYLCSLDCTSLPVWTGLDSMGTHDQCFNFTWTFLTTSPLKTAGSVSWETFIVQTVTILSFIATAGIWRHQFGATLFELFSVLSIALEQIYCCYNITSKRLTILWKKMWVHQSVQMLTITGTLKDGNC